MDTMKKYRFSSFDFHVFLVLLSIEILMSFTFFGYIHFPPISITFAYLPILIAACVLGTKEAAALGAVFGLASMYKSTVYSAQPADMLFSPVLSGKPIASLFMALGVRILFAFLAGIAFGAAKRCKRSDLCIGIVSFFAPLVHALLILAAFYIFFPESVEKSFCSPYIIISNALSVVVCVVIVEIVWKVFNNDKFRDGRLAIDCACLISYGNSGRRRKIIALFSAFIFFMTIVAALYFSDGTSHMLKTHGVAVSEFVENDLFNLQIQFTAAALSLNMIGVVVLNLVYQYSAYKNFMGEFDAVTGVMGRRIFIGCCERAQKRVGSGECSDGWFIFIDIDNFKTINDTFGHSAGDDVLKKFALIMKDVFDDYGICGRMGGDEFAVMLDKSVLTGDEVGKMLEDFLQKIAEIMPESNTVSCSIGACRFSFPEDVALLMDKADGLLYKAKQNGRACYVLGEYKSKGE